MHLPLVVYLAIALIGAMVSQQIARRLKIPTVTVYVIFGALLGGSFLGHESSLRDLVFFNGNVLEHFGVVSDLALGLVAFSIGAELDRRRLAKLGKSIFFITVCEAFGAFFVVTVSLGLFFHGKDWPLAILLGAIASATAPAATVAVIRQYHASGPLTDTVLAVVGIDDAVALIIYQFAASIAHSAFGDAALNKVMMVSLPVMEVGASLLLGAVCGMVAFFVLVHSRSPELLSFAGVTSIVTTLALVELVEQAFPHFHCSMLLAVMAMAAVLVNFSPVLKSRVSDAIKGFVPFFFAFFFILGGAHLDMLALPVVGVTALIYLLARMVGKVSGASLGAWLGKAQPVVRRFVGFSLIPQVGVAVALAYAVSKEFAGHDQLVCVCMNVLLFTTLVTEVVGPLLTRYALIKSGEAKGEVG